MKTNNIFTFVFGFKSPFFVESSFRRVGTKVPALELNFDRRFLCGS